MKVIEDGIVFSNDIKRILDGSNSLNFSYQDKEMFLPNEELYKEIRQDFERDTKEIFNNKVKIIEEQEMVEGLKSSLSDCLGRYPHCFIR